MYSHGRSCGAGPYLYEVAHLVGEPQTVIFTLAGRAPADERVNDDSVVDHLADQLVRLTEDPDGT